MALHRRLIVVAGGLAVPIDRAIADLYGWDTKSVVEITPDVDSLRVARAPVASPAEPPTTPPLKPKYAPASAVVPDHVVRLCVNENPKMIGSACRKRFDLYRDGMTVDDAMKAGVWRQDIQWDLAHGFIRLEDPAQPS
jgi:hypothetical protein